MKTNKLGSSGPDISVVGFGAWEAGGRAWGPNPPDEQVVEAMVAGFDAGMNWIDTAEVYGGGRSEELVAQAVEGRDDILVFTKVAPQPQGTGFRRGQIRRAVEQSLGRLGRERIDLYQLHWPDGSEAPIEETWEAMAGLVDDGAVRCIGVSNFDRKLIEKCEKVRHVDSLQPHFSLFHQDGLDDLFPYCESNGTGIIAYGPLAFGLLTGAFDKDTKFDDSDWRSGKHGMRAYDSMFAPGKYDNLIDKVEALKPTADRLGISQAQLALSWVIHQRGVTGAIAGSRNPKHVGDNSGAGDVVLEEKDLDEIRSVVSD